MNLRRAQQRLKDRRSGSWGSSSSSSLTASPATISGEDDGDCAFLSRSAGVEKSNDEAADLTTSAAIENDEAECLLFSPRKSSTATDGAEASERAAVTPDLPSPAAAAAGSGSSRIGGSDLNQVMKYL